VKASDFNRQLIQGSKERSINNDSTGCRDRPSPAEPLQMMMMTGKVRGYD
jgi:hypothetical protein